MLHPTLSEFYELINKYLSKTGEILKSVIDRKKQESAIIITANEDTSKVYNALPKSKHPITLKDQLYSANSHQLGVTTGVQKVEPSYLNVSRANERPYFNTSISNINQSAIERSQLMNSNIYFDKDTAEHMDQAQIDREKINQMTEYKLIPIWTSKKKEKVNEWFKIQKKENKRLRSLARKFKIIERKRLKEGPDVKEETDVDIRSQRIKDNVNKRLMMSARNYNPSYRKHVFTPEAALSALPALQINTIIPNEHISEGIVKYKKQSRNRQEFRTNVKTAQHHTAISWGTKMSPKKPIKHHQTVKPNTVDFSTMSKKKTVFYIKMDQNNGSKGDGEKEYTKT